MILFTVINLGLKTQIKRRDFRTTLRVMQTPFSGRLFFRYMATSGVDRKLKIWDLRTYKELRCYKLGAGPGHLSFSQRGLLAAGIGNVVEVRLFVHFLSFFVRMCAFAVVVFFVTMHLSYPR